MIGYEGTIPKVIEKVEVYDMDGVHKFILDRGTLIPDLANEGESDCYHVTMTDEKGNVTGFNWSRIPLIPLKANEQETPLLKKIKSLQDGINVMLSDFENNMQEDARNTILVLKNYDVILSILVDTFISKISFPMQPGPEIGSISDA